MNDIISLDEKSGIVVCQAGCILENINKYLERKDFIVPIDIGSKGSCQIGGNVSTNAGGFRFARFGSLHGNVLGLEVVKASGEVLDCLKALRKDNTGYHLKNLFIGAEGTLGFITKVALQCVTKPKATNVAFLGIQSYENVLKTYQCAKETLGEILSAAEVLDAGTMEVATTELNHHSPIGNYPFYLLIETLGTNEEHDLEKMDTFLKVSLEKQFVLNGTVASDISKRQEIWKMRECIALANRKGEYKFHYDLTLPLKDFYSIVLIMRKHMDTKARSVYGFGHLGDGNVHLDIAVPEYSTELRNHIEPYIFEKVLELNGSISAEHCLGFKNAKYLPLGRNELYVNTMKDIKAIMDPNAILNPYKVIPY